MNNFPKRFVFLLLTLILAALFFMEKEIRAEIDPTVFKFSMNIKQIAFHREGTLGVIAGNEIILLDINTKKKTVLSSGGKNIAAMAFSPDGSYLAVGHGALVNGRAVPNQEDTGAELWDLESGEMISLTNSIVGNDKRSGIFVVAFSPDSKYLATSSEMNGKGIVDVWDVQTKTKKVTLNDKTIPTMIKTLPDGEWKPTTRTILDVGYPTALIFSQDGKYLVLGVDTLCIWDADTGQFIKQLSTNIQDPQELRYSPDYRILALAGRVSYPVEKSSALETRGEVQLLDINTEMLVKKIIRGNKFNTHSLDLSPNGKYLAIAWDTYDRSPKPVIQLLEFESDRNIDYEFDHPGYQGDTSVAFSPDGTKFAAASGQYIKIWKIEE